jgi:hypothetical protein
MPKLATIFDIERERGIRRLVPNRIFGGYSKRQVVSSTGH